MQKYAVADIARQHIHMLPHTELVLAHWIIVVIAWSKASPVADVRLQLWESPVLYVSQGGQDMNICKNYPIVGVFFITIFYPYVALAVCKPTGTSCSACTTYRCNSGYYGTALSASRGCTRCPTNATCAGGNNSTFVCNTGYYKNGSESVIWHNIWQWRNNNNTMLHPVWNQRQWFYWSIRIHWYIL